MSCLAVRPEIIGFFSYSREDDEDSEGALTQLRERIQRELSSQLGRSRAEFRLWQDKSAIPLGTLWDKEIAVAIAQSVFFIPIISPRAVKSGHCEREFQAFLAREAELGRDDLVFPILYIPVPELEHQNIWRNDPVLKIVGTRQYVDWSDLRHRDPSATEVRARIEVFCRSIASALRRQYAKAEEHQRLAVPPLPRLDPIERNRAAAVIETNPSVDAERTREEQSPLVAARRLDPAGKLRRPWLIGSCTILFLGVAAFAWTLLRSHGPPLEQRVAASPAAPPTTRAAPASTPAFVTASSTIAPLTPERERSLQPMASFQECAGCPEMVVIPAGQFIMGSDASDVADDLAAANEQPQHKVVIARPFAVGRFEVTKDQFEAFVRASGYKPGDRCFTFENGVPQERANRSFRNPGFPQSGNHPAVCVNWTDAKAYVAWLAQITGKAYRLPSESEWEYAARGGSASRFGFGSDPAELCQFANGADQTAKLAKLPAAYSYMKCTDGFAYTAPVGSFAANAWGLFDSLGNVWEATEDCYADDYSAMPTDGSARKAADCAGRTVRGGSWYSNVGTLRPAVRARAAPNERHDDLGFRVARTLAQ